MGFHNHPKDFEYLKWTWKDYLVRWLVVIAVIASATGFVIVAVSSQ